MEQAGNQEITDATHDWIENVGEKEIDLVRFAFLTGQKIGIMIIQNIIQTYLLQKIMIHS